MLWYTDWTMKYATEALDAVVSKSTGYVTLPSSSLASVSPPEHVESITAAVPSHPNEPNYASSVSLRLQILV